MKKNLNDSRIRRKVKRFLTSYKPILFVLIIFIVVLLVYCNYLLKSVKVYEFYGSSDYVNISNGVISLNYDINLLEGSDIEYKKAKDIIVTDYKIGYYVKDGDNLLSIAVVEDSDKEGFSLQSVLEGVNTFNIVELNKNNFHFSKQKIELLNNGFYFAIEATDSKGNEIVDIVEMKLTKLTK